MRLLRFLVTTLTRQPGRLEQWPALDDPPLAVLLAAVDGRADQEVEWRLDGGEPTLRADLPAIVQGMAGRGLVVGLACDGLALDAPGVARGLRDRGLARVAVRVHCGRPDAHDWLVGRPGAGRRALRAVRSCREAGLEVEVECALTRPTTPHLEETVQVVARLGASRVRLRWPAPARLSEADVAAVSPRIAAVGEHVHRAADCARSLGLEFVLEEVPACAWRPAGRAAASTAEVRWVIPDHPGWGALAGRWAVQTPRCPSCPGPPRCPGAPAGYVERFGWCELDSAAAAGVGGGLHVSGHRTDEASPGGEPPAGRARAVSPPPPRAGRPPATRLDELAGLLRLGAPEGDPLAGQAPPAALSVGFAGPSSVRCAACGDAGADAPEPTRDIRLRLVRAAQEGVPVLRVVSASSLAHPAAAGLLEDAARLSFAAVEVSTEASGLDSMSDAELQRLRGLARVEAALFGAGADTHDAHTGRTGSFAAALRGLSRLQAAAGVAVGTYAVLHDAGQVPSFAAAWSRGSLPGEPAFRLSPQGGSLAELAAAARALGEDAAREALASVLPPCLLERGPAVAPAGRAGPIWGNGRCERRPPSGCDRLGTYRPCPQAEACEAAPSCPGLAEGWSDVGIQPVAGAGG